MANYVQSRVHWPQLVITTLSRRLDVIKTGNLRDPLVNILQLLQKDFNCTLITPNDGQYGSLVEGTNRWTGMLGLLVNETADVALASLGISYGRYKAVDFSHYLDIEAHHIFSILPGESEDAESDIMEIFSSIDQWNYLALFSSVFVVALLNFVAEKVINNAKKQNYSSTFTPMYTKNFIEKVTVQTLQQNIHGRSRSRVLRNEAKVKLRRIHRIRDPPQPSLLARTPQNLFRIFYDLYAFIVGQGVPLLPQSVSARTMACIFGFGMTFFTVWFSSCIQTNLVIENEKHLIDNLESIAKHTKIIPILGKGTLVEEIFKHSPADSIYRELWNRIKQKPKDALVASNDLWSNRVAKNLLSRSHVLINADPVLNDIAEALCKKYPESNFYFSAENLFDNQHALAYRRTLGADIRETINKKLSVIVESGIYNFWASHKFGLKPACFYEDDADNISDETVPLDIINFAILLYVKVVGDVIALLVLIVEIMIARRIRPINQMKFCFHRNVKLIKRKVKAKKQMVHQSVTDS